MTKQTGIRAAALLLVAVASPLLQAAPRDGITAEDRAHWAFQKVTRPAAPQIQNSKFKIQNEVDAFLVAELETKGIDPSAPADKITLLRRASLDLTGLPPTPE